MATAPYRKFLTVADTAARQTGPMLVKYAGRPKSVLTKRSAIDLVTEIDKAAETRLRRAILSAFPDHGIFGEEHARINPDSPYQWIIDPIDGTTNFVHGVPYFAISIGLALRGTLIAGLVYDPTRPEMFSAVKGGGAKLNGRRISVSPAKRLEDSLLSTGFPSDFRKDPSKYLGWFRAFQDQCHAVRRTGSTALSLAYVACGRQDGFYETNLWPWDIAAGILLVEEAGGRVTDFTGRPAVVGTGRSELVASNRHIHRSILALL